MAYTTVNKSSLFMNTKLYTGNANANHGVTGVGFQPDWTWLKQRDGTRTHRLYDAIRGATYWIDSSATNASTVDTNGLKSFNSDGFTLGTGGISNENNANFVSWNWVGGTSVSGNTSGSGTSRSYTGRINTTSKFGIYKYQGNGTGGHTIPHGLGAVPTMIITHRINDAEIFVNYHKKLTASKFIRWNSTTTPQTASNRWNGTTPTSTVFTLGSEGEVNGGSDTYITYVFCDVPGYCKVGSYTGNGDADGTFSYTGFNPTWVMTKCISDTSNWEIKDNKRSTFNTVDDFLKSNASSAEDTGVASHAMDFLSNGFKQKGGNDETNGQNREYIFMAFGQSLVGTNNIPATAK